MVKRQKKLFFSVIGISIIVISVVFMYWFLTMSRFFTLFQAHPKPNAEWRISEPNMTVLSDEKGNLYGELYLDESTLNLSFYLRNNHVFAYITENDENLFSGNFSINKSGDIIIKDITSQNKLWNSDRGKMTLKKQKK